MRIKSEKNMQSSIRFLNFYNIIQSGESCQHLKLTLFKNVERLTRWGYARCHETLTAEPAKNDVRVEPKNRMEIKL